MKPWEGSTRRATLPQNWTSVIVPEVKRRARFQCQWPGCPRRGDEVDHIDSSERGRLDHRYANLQLLCEDHHRQKTLAEAAQGRRRYLSPKWQERHPGEISDGNDPRDGGSRPRRHGGRR